MVRDIVEAARFPELAGAPYGVFGLFEQLGRVDEQVPAPFLDAELQVIGAARRLENSSPAKTDAVTRLRIAEIGPTLVGAARSIFAQRLEVICLVAGLGEEVAVLARRVDLIGRAQRVHPVGERRHQRRRSAGNRGEVFGGDGEGHGALLESGVTGVAL